MKHYNLTKDAEKDLREIARYTLNQWGKEKNQKYRDGLKHVFNNTGKNQIQKNTFSNNIPKLLVTKYQYHFIFYLTDNAEKPIIIGVIHERRDIVERLKERLG